MAERRDEMNVARWRCNPGDLFDDLFGPAHVFEDRIALHSLERVGAKREMLGVGHHVDTGLRIQIDVDVSGNPAAGPTQIKIPSAQRKIGRLARIRNERERRLQITIKPIRPAPRSSTRIGLLHSRWDHAHSLEQRSEGSTL
jgi:hypothetical protein